MAYSDCIIYHGDFDGVVSAAFVALGMGARNALMIPAEPFTVDRALKRILKEGFFSRIFSADIAPNNKKAGMTSKFISGCSERCDRFLLYDHHHGWEKFFFPRNCEALVDVTASSCAGHLFKKMWPAGGFPPGADELARDADIADSGGYEGLSDEGGLVFRALKADLKEASIRDAALRYLVSGYSDVAARRIMAEKASFYDGILGRSLEMAEKAAELSPGICFVDTSGVSCDMTAVIRECYKKFRIVIIEYSTVGNSFYIIATCDPSVNILEKLGMKSGSRYRATIIKTDLRAVASRLAR